MHPTVNDVSQNSSSSWADRAFGAICGIGISLLAHVALLLALALLALQGTNWTGSLPLMVAPSASESDSPESEFFPIDLSATSLAPTVDSGAPMQIAESVVDLPAVAEIGQLTSIQTMDPPSVGTSSGLTGLVASAVGMGSGRGQGQGPGQGPGQGAGLAGVGASFFGVNTGGEKFVFVVDSSRSMAGKRWNHAIRELIQSLDSLGPDQRFYVICFDFDARPVFGSTPGLEAYLRPDSQTVGQVQYWLQHLVNGFETRPANALQMAMAMKPDAIYLLSDGEIRDNSMLMLRNLNRDRQSGKPIIPVHTISLFSTEGKQALQMIAASNGGKFTSID